MCSNLHNVSVMFPWVARSLPCLLSLLFLPRMTMNSATRLHQAWAPLDLPGLHIHAFSRDTVLSCLECNVIRKQFGPHAQLPWSLGMAPACLWRGSFCSASAVLWNVSQLGDPGADLFGARAWPDSRSVRCCLLKASGVTLKPQVSYAPWHKQRRLTSLARAAWFLCPKYRPAGGTLDPQVPFIMLLTSFSYSPWLLALSLRIGSHF